jgi:hypothetical protein
MVTFQLTEQDKTDNRWSGVRRIVDSKKKMENSYQYAGYTTYYMMGCKIHYTRTSGRVSLEYNMVEWTS